MLGVEATYYCDIQLGSFNFGFTRKTKGFIREELNLCSGMNHTELQRGF